MVVEDSNVRVLCHKMIVRFEGRAQDGREGSPSSAGAKVKEPNRCKTHHVLTYDKAQEVLTDPTSQMLKS